MKIGVPGLILSIFGTPKIARQAERKIEQSGESVGIFAEQASVASPSGPASLGAPPASGSPSSVSLGTPPGTPPGSDGSDEEVGPLRRRVSPPFVTYRARFCKFNSHYNMPGTDPIEKHAGVPEGRVIENEIVEEPGHRVGEKRPENPRIMNDPSIVYEERGERAVSLGTPSGTPPGSGEEDAEESDEEVGPLPRRVPPPFIPPPFVGRLALGSLPAYVSEEEEEVAGELVGEGLGSW